MAEPGAENKQQRSTRQAIMKTRHTQDPARLRGLNSTTTHVPARQPRSLRLTLLVCLGFLLTVAFVP